MSLVSGRLGPTPTVPERQECLMSDDSVVEKYWQ
jgi:hypothetical protein